MFAFRDRSHSSLMLTCIVALGFANISSDSNAQERFEARSVSAPAPQAISPDPLAFSAPMSNSEANDREGLLGAHHRPTPIAALPPDALALPPPAPPAHNSSKDSFHWISFSCVVMVLSWLSGSAQLLLNPPRGGTWRHLQAFTLCRQDHFNCQREFVTSPPELSTR